MSWTHTEPSPTADATRLTLPDRASPTAKTPAHARLQQIGPAGERPSRLFELIGVELWRRS